MGNANRSESGVSISNSNEASRIAVYVRSSLGTTIEKVDAYALLCQDVWNYINDNPEIRSSLEIYKKGKAAKDLYKGSKRVVLTTVLLRNTEEMVANSVIPKFKTIRASGVLHTL